MPNLEHSEALGVLFQLGFIMSLQFFCFPHLEYCSPLLLGVVKVQASRLEDANFYILRSILGYGKTISSQEILGIVNMKTLEQRRLCM